MKVNAPLVLGACPRFLGSIWRKRRTGDALLRITRQAGLRVVEIARPAYSSRNDPQSCRYIRGQQWSSFRASNRATCRAEMARASAIENWRENGGSLTPQNHIGQINEFCTCASIAVPVRRVAGFKCRKNNRPVAAIVGQGACIRWLPNMCVRSVAGLSA
jgi:hypothetical protein